MADYYLYVDVSRESEAIERELKEKGFQFIKVHREPGGRILPSLTGPQGVFEGSANIKLYFIDRKLRRAPA